MGKITKTIAIIGGGPAGLAAAISAKKVDPSTKVIVFEKADTPGKTILKTGNGRCNFSNSAAAFPTQKVYINATFVKKIQQNALNKIVKHNIFNSTNSQASLNFMEDCGLVWNTEQNGMIFPYSNQAKTVQKLLVNKANMLGIEFFKESEVMQIKPVNEKFDVYSDQGILLSDKVIISTGGGTTNLLNNKVKTKNTSKVLGPIITKERIPKKCNGVRARAKVTLITKKNKVFEEEGQVLFRKYGVSGIVIFNASRFIEEDKNQKLVLDLIPDKNEDEVFCYFKNLTNAHCLHDMLLGLLPLELEELIRQYFIKTNLEFNESTVAHAVKNLSLTAKSVGESKQCQVTRGGIEVSEINETSMEISKCPGVFVAGEIVDVDGACGGFNLDWTWTSGILAGISAAE